MARALTIALCLMMVISTMAIKTRLTAAQEKKIKELKDQKVGRIILGLAELHIMSQGPFEELVEAIDALIADTEEKIADNDEAYNERSLQNQSEITRLTGLITDAQVQISNTENVLNNILYPALEQLQENLAGLHGEVEENNAYVEKITFEREEAHEAYEGRVAELNDAVGAVDECLEILDSFGGAALSLVQVNKVKLSLNKVTKKLPKRGIEQSLIKALITLATGEFADQSAIQRVVHALEDIKQTALDALQAEHDEEARQVETFEEEVHAREEDNKRLGREINTTNGEIDGTENRIAEKETYLAVKNNDLATFEGQLEDENDAFEEATEFYEDVREQLGHELSVANDAAGLV